jgi:RNA-directed DNA polymerase
MADHDEDDELDDGVDEPPGEELETDDVDGDDLDDEVDDESVPTLDRDTVRTIAGALCESDWEPGSMRAKLDATVEPRTVPEPDRPRVYPTQEMLARGLERSGSTTRKPLELEDEALAREWLASLVLEAHAAFATRPSVDDLAAWIYPRARIAGLPPFQVLRVPTPAPEMRESRWRVPALATTRELAMWLGISIQMLDSFARRRPDRSTLDTGLPASASGAVVATASDVGAVAVSVTDAVAASDAGVVAASDAVAGSVPDVRARHYRFRWISKPRGGYRLLEAPKPRLRAVQRDLLDGILAHIEPHAAAFAFRAGRSVVDFARQHAGRETVIRLDLASFFTSVIAPRVAGILRAAGYPDEVARCIAAICTHRTPSDVIADRPGGARGPVASFEDAARLRAPHLPQGAPTSGALANLAAYRLDVRIAALAARVGATYGRYADDLVLSGDRTLAKRAPSIIARVGAIAIEEGFALNHRKTRVMTTADQQRVVGIVVNTKPAVAREEIERLRAILTNCARTGPDAQNREGVPDFRAHLRGRIAWVAQLDHVKGAHLRAMYDRIPWPTR